MVSQFFLEKNPLVVWILPELFWFQLWHFLSHLLFTGPGSIIARPLGARSCNFSHQWRMSWSCFKDSISKAFLIVRWFSLLVLVQLGYHLGYKNCAIKFGWFYFGISTYNIQIYTLSIKSHFIKHFSSHLPQVATTSKQTKLFITPHNY